MGTKKKKNLSVADKIIGGLKNFADALESQQETEAVFKQFNSRRFVLDLEPIEYGSADVKRVREEILHVSQAIFAQFLGVSIKTVRAWEQGENRPQDIAARFMDEIQSDPSYWQKRLTDHIRPKVELIESDSD